ncbi:transposon unclassified [Hordeum vulgare]|nr:transposon unclassified [Hordeum vulgare]
MAPAGKKGKATASGASAAAAGLALMPSCNSKAEALGPVLPFASDDMNEGAMTVIWPGLATPRSLMKNAHPFIQNIYAGLVPPFSDFFYDILSLYQIRALHLQPNSVLLLAVSALYCKAFMRVRPSVTLFRHFFSLGFTTQGQRSTCVSFVDVVGSGTCLKAEKKVEGYRNHLVFMDARQESSLLATPLGPPEQTPKCIHKKLIDPMAGPILE